MTEPSESNHHTNQRLDKHSKQISAYQKALNEWQIFLVAVQFLTRIPIILTHYKPQWLHQSSRHFAGVGLLIGAICALMFWLLSVFFSPLIAAVGSTAFGIKLTGAFHEDGLADTCDGLGGGLTRERTLTIMKDSRLGTYGTLGLVCALLLKISLLASMPVSVALLALIIAHSVSRFLCTLLIVVLPYGGEIEHAKAKPMVQQMTRQQWLASSGWLVVLGLTLCAFALEALTQIALEQWLMATSLALLAVAYMYRLLKRRLGGYTGDGLGATQQLCEVAIYAGFAMTLPTFN